MKRRKFLQLTGMGATGLSLQPLWEPRNDDRSIYSFPQMVGEVARTSAILQTRLASQGAMPDSPFDSPEVLVRQDISGAGGVGRFEIAEESSFDRAAKTSWKFAEPNNDFIIKHKMERLKPNMHYYMRVRFGLSKEETTTGPVSQFRTLPAKNMESAVSFVVSSCMNLGFFFLGHQRSGNWGNRAEGRERKLGYPSLESMEQLSPDFWVQTGDNVYYDHPGEEKYRAKSQHEMRAKWHRQMGMPRMQRLLQNVPAYWMVDDHDFRYNDSDDQSNNKKPSVALAKTTFREQVPVVDPEQSETVIYRTRWVNKLLQIWTMDGREHRDNNNDPDGPNKSMWGKEQYEWLKRTLLSSTATFKLLIVGSPLIGPDDAYKHDNHTNYGGFQRERDQFLRWLKTHNFLEKNFYIITGDRHWQYHSVHPSGFEEFGTGTLTTQNARHGRKPGDPDSTDPLGLITQPYIQEEPIAGFIRVKVEPPEKDRPALLVFETIDEKGNILNSETKRAK